ncbi:hypothetical protein ABZ778_32170 [Streptomyces bacillaris]|uniref:hypothetical protein n=1 Tax=Streptomyces bacillaris TaxID=68179 RepID=UPI003460755C
MAHLGTPPCHLLSATGRTIARTPTARALPAAEASRQLASALRVDPEASPYGQWFLHLPGAVEVPPRMLHEIAEVFAQYRQGSLRREAAAQAPARELLALAEAERSAAAPLPAALRACGLPGAGAVHGDGDGHGGGGEHGGRRPAGGAAASGGPPVRDGPPGGGAGRRR